MTPEVKELVDALIGPSRQRYEEVRADRIDRFGYDGFRDQQREAFAQIAREGRTWSFKSDVKGGGA